MTRHQVIERLTRLLALAGTHGVSRAAIYQAFAHHTSARSIAEGLERLARDGLAETWREKTRGRSVEKWRAASSVQTEHDPTIAHAQEAIAHAQEAVGAAPEATPTEADTQAQDFCLTCSHILWQERAVGIGRRCALCGTIDHRGE